MAEFSINCVKTSNSAEQFSKFAQEIRNIKGQVQYIRKGINTSSDAMQQLGRVIAQIEESILNEAVKMDSLVEALIRITESYQTTEGKIAAHGDGISGDPDKRLSEVQEHLWEFFRQMRGVLVSLGFVKAEKQERIPGQDVKSYQEREMNRYMQNEVSKILKQERFSEKTWKKAGVEERKRILDEYLQVVADIMGLSIGPIYFDYLPEENGYYTMGYYTSEMHLVSINEWVVENREDSYNLMSTIAHEMRHAYQNAACNNPERFVVTEDTIQKWQDSFDNYKSMEGFMRDDDMSEQEAYEAYRNQAVEKDARKFARQD